MKLFRWLVLAIALTLLGACSTSDGVNPFAASPTATLPPPFVGITRAPDASGTMYGFLDALRGNDYAGMYALLDRDSQAAITQDDFIQRYRDVLNAMSAASLDYEAVSVVPSPALAQATFRITYHSTLAGDIARDFTATLHFEEGLWRLAWDPGLILPELAGGNRLASDCSAPARGDIFDRDGEPLVYTTEAAALGVDTTYVDYNTLTTFTTELGRLVGVNPEIIENQILASGP
ncbi:MAG: NTF2-like N-terminal transpeptidase domain-containing protein, partial [Chloroflexota bacterium]